MAKRAINTAGSTPAGYDAGYTTLVAAVAAGGSGDELRFTDPINLNGAATVTYSCTIGVDSESGSGVADIAHEGTAIWSATRAGITNGGVRADGDGITVVVEWLQGDSSATAGNPIFWATDNSTIILKNCYAQCNNRYPTAFMARTQTSISTGGTAICYYCVSTHNDTVSWGGEALKAWMHSSSVGNPCDVKAYNCSFLQATDAGMPAESGQTLGNATPDPTCYGDSNQFYCLTAFNVGVGSGGFIPTPDGGYNASTNTEAIDLGDESWEDIDIADEFEAVTIAGGLDWTPTFTTRRVGEDNSAEAAKNDDGDPADFRGLPILTFNIGAFDESVEPAGGGNPQQQLLTTTLTPLKSNGHRHVRRAVARGQARKTGAARGSKRWPGKRRQGVRSWR